MRQNLIIAILVIALVLVFGYILESAMGDPFAKNQTATPKAQQTVQEDKVKIEDITVGTGQEVKAGDTVVINYKGMLENGKVFDSSYDRGQPFTTQIGTGQVIKGWDEGVPGMKVGGKRRLTIPPSLGYGAQGAPPTIPPNATLIFEVELMGIQ